MELLNTYGGIIVLAASVIVVILMWRIHSQMKTLIERLSPNGPILSGENCCGNLEPGVSAPAPPVRWVEHRLEFQNATDPKGKLLGFGVSRPNGGRMSRNQSPLVLVLNNSSYDISWKLPDGPNSLTEGFCNSPQDPYLLAKNGGYYRLRMRCNVRFPDNNDLPLTNRTTFHGDLQTTPNRLGGGDGDDMYLEC